MTTESVKLSDEEGCSLQSLQDDVCIKNITEHIKWLTTHTPNRISSGDDVTRAADYVVDELRSYGFEAENEFFYTYNSTPIFSKLELLCGGEVVQLKSLPCGHIRSTLSVGEEYDLIYIDSHNYANIHDVNVKGKMVLVEMSYAPPVPEKSRVLHEAGAAGMICMNWGNDEDVICNRALKAIWGNPTEETFPNIPNIIGVGVTRKTGLMLKKRCLESGSVRVRVTATATREWQRVAQPFGVLRGNGRSKEFLLISSHLDAWQPGVTCNATGNGMTLELCRVLAKHRELLDRDIWVTFWNGHEIAEAAGSTWFLDNHWDMLNKGCISYMHIDSPGLKDAEIFEIKSSDELLAFAKANAQQCSALALRATTLKKIGDQSFMGIGIPSVAQRMSYTSEYMDSQHGATLGWWNHTEEDGIDKYDEDVMKNDVKISLSLIFKLCTLKTLPYDFREKFRDAEKIVGEFAAKYSAKIDLSDILTNLSEVRRVIEAAELKRGEIRSDEDIALFNSFLLAVSRCVTNVFQTYASKYEQDSYGYGRLAAPIPLLSDLTGLIKLQEGSLEYGLVMTKLIRNRNRISDSLRAVLNMASFYKL